MSSESLFPSRCLSGVEEQRKLHENSNTATLVKTSLSSSLAEPKFWFIFAFIQGDVYRVNYEESNPKSLSKGGSSPLANCRDLCLVPFPWDTFQSVSHFVCMVDIIFTLQIRGRGSDQKWQR